MTPQGNKPAPGFPWRLFWVLFVACVLSVFASAPLVLELFGPTLAQAQLPPIPVPVLILLGAVQNLVLLGLFVGLGLVLSRRLGLGPKLTKAWLDGTLSRSELSTVVRVGVPSGLGVGLVVTPILLLLASHLPSLPFVTAGHVAIWKRVLACVYGGVYEEVFTRLFLLSLLLWLFNRGWRSQRRQPGPAVFWAANLIVAILFGLGHLPGASLVMPITPLVVAAALLLNGIAALTFGYLYWKRNLETAMVAHFTADFVLWVVGPFFLSK